MAVDGIKKFFILWIFVRDDNDAAPVSLLNFSVFRKFSDV